MKTYRFWILLFHCTIVWVCITVTMSINKVKFEKRRNWFYYSTSLLLFSSSDNLAQDQERGVNRRQSDQLLADLPSGFKFSDFQQKLTNAEEKSHFLESTLGKCWSKLITLFFISATCLWQSQQNWDNLSKTEIGF